MRLDMAESSVPENNLRAYEIIFTIEVGLRELIIDKLQNCAGSRWWKLRLPSNVLKSYRAGREYERLIKWLQLMPLHPLYYVDFGDLRKTIERNDNWTEVFKPVFGSKQWISTSLTELEPIRNRVAHNRPITALDVQMADSVLISIKSAVGEATFNGYVASFSLYPSVVETLSALRQEARKGMTSCHKFAPIDTL